jgi:hypothetical protein
MDLLAQQALAGRHDVVDLGVEWVGVQALWLGDLDSNQD